MVWSRKVLKNSTRSSSLLDVLDKHILALLRPAVDRTSYVATIREMLKPPIEQVICCERRDRFIVCVEIRNAPFRIPPIPATKADYRQARLRDKGATAGSSKSAIIPSPSHERRSGSR